MNLIWLAVAAIFASTSALPRTKRNANFYYPHHEYPAFGHYPPQPPYHPGPGHLKPYGSAVCNLMAANNSMVMGQLFFDQQTSLGPVFINGDIFHLTPGRHGFHVHENGDTGDECKAAGAHFNPTNKKHGAPDDLQRHVGDLGNIVAGSDGVARIGILDSEISLVDKNPRNIIGKSIVVHADEDDLGKGEGDSETTGNAGGRLACCVIEAPKFFF